MFNLKGVEVDSKKGQRCLYGSGIHLWKLLTGAEKLKGLRM